MPHLVLAAVAISVAVVCARGPLRAAAATLVGVLFLVPDSIGIPYAFHSLTIVRLAIVAAAAGLVVRALRRQIPWSALAFGRAHAALLAYVAYAYFAGVSSAIYPALFSPALNQWFAAVDQIVFLWVAIAFVRLLGLRWMALCVATVAAATAAIAVGEWASGSSWARHWFDHPPATGPGGLLEHRGAVVRVRAASEFALEFGWLMAAVLPLSIALAVQARRRIALVAPVLVALAMVLSVSRSAFLGAALGAVILVVLSGFERRVTTVVCAGALLAGLAYLAVPALHRPFVAAAATDSINSRARRLTALAGATVNHPLTGLGLDGAGARGIFSTDDSFLFTYASLGAIGLVLLVGAIGVPAVEGASMSLRGAPDRLNVAAATGGVAVGLLDAGAYDSLVVPASAITLWLLAALAVGQRPGRPGSGRMVAERVDRPRWSAWPVPVRLLLPVAGICAGVLIFHAFSTGVAATSELSVLAARQVDVPASSRAPGNILAGAVCTAGRAAVGPAVSVGCNPDSVGPGTAYLRIAGRSERQVDAALAAFDAAAQDVDHPYARVVLSVTTGRPTPARVAPVVGGLLGAGIALFLPLAPFERRRRGHVVLAA